MKVPDVGNMVVMVSAVLFTVLSLCAHRTSAQVAVVTPAATIKFQSTTGPTMSTHRTTFPPKKATTVFVPTTVYRKPVVQWPSTKGYPVGVTKFYPRDEVSGSSIPRCSWSMWLVVTGASLYTLRHLLLQ